MEIRFTGKESLILKRINKASGIREELLTRKDAIIEAYIDGKLTIKDNEGEKMELTEEEMEEVIGKLEAEDNIKIQKEEDNMELNLKEKKVTELHELAKTYGVKNYKNKKKDKLAEELEQIIKEDTEVQDEAQEEAAAGKEKEKKKEKKKGRSRFSADVPAEKIWTTKELAQYLQITPKKLRTFLRSIPKYNDKNYTIYEWHVEDDKAELERIIEAYFNPEQKDKV